MTSATKPPSQVRRPRVLVVDDEPDLLDVVRDCALREVDADIVYAETVSRARELIAEAPVDVMLADINLPDGDGRSLVDELHQLSPAAGAIVITGKPSVQNAVESLRRGAVDFVPKPFTGGQIAERVNAALERKKLIDAQDRRLEKLKCAVRRLNRARKTVSQKVDLLCNDLITAYGELSRDVSGVRNEEAFRQCITQAKGLEQMLCHAMDWLLRRLGYSNVAVWLAAEDGEFQLGAYMKYTLAGDPLLTNALKRAVLPKLRNDTATTVEVASLKAKLDKEELALLKGQTVVGTVCTYLGESLAAIVFFRDEASPFTESDLATLQSIAPIFAVALASVVGDSADGPTDAPGDHDTPGHPGDAPKNKPARDDGKDDWWKRGEPPPF